MVGSTPNIFVDLTAFGSTGRDLPPPNNYGMLVSKRQNYLTQSKKHEFQLSKDLNLENTKEGCFQGSPILQSVDNDRTGSSKIINQGMHNFDISPAYSKILLPSGSSQEYNGRSNEIARSSTYASSDSQNSPTSLEAIFLETEERNEKINNVTGKKRMKSKDIWLIEKITRDIGLRRQTTICTQVKNQTAKQIHSSLYNGSDAEGMTDGAMRSRHSN